MPSRGKRIAARQGNLRRRRTNNANRSNTPVPERSTAVAESEPTTADSAVSAASGQAAPASAPAAATQAIGRPQSQPRGRRFDRPAAYNHVRSEITRIGIFSGVLVVVLVAVSFII